ncbi:hypothetical protein Tco_0317014, partial [Tanacetum coccineum]
MSRCQERLESDSRSSREESKPRVGLYTLLADGKKHMSSSWATKEYHILLTKRWKIVELMSPLSSISHLNQRPYGLLRRFYSRHTPICLEAYGFTVWSESSVTGIHPYAQKRMSLFPYI